MKPSTNLILKTYEKFGDIPTTSLELEIDDSEVLVALAEAPPGWITSIVRARTLDAFCEGVRHLRKCFKTMRAPSTSACVRDLGKLLTELQGKGGSTGGAPLGLSPTELKRLEQAKKGLDDDGDS